MIVATIRIVIITLFHQYVIYNRYKCTLNLYIKLTYYYKYVS